MVAVADREGVGQRVLERDVGAGEVAHRLLGPWPAIQRFQAPPFQASCVPAQLWSRSPARCASYWLVSMWNGSRYAVRPGGVGLLEDVRAAG